MLKIVYLWLHLFIDLIFFCIRKVTSQPYSRFPGNRSTLRVCFGPDTTSCMVRFGRPFTVIVQDKLPEICPKCFIRNEEIHLGCFHQPDYNSLSSLSPVAPSTDVRKAHEFPATLQASKIPMPLEIHAPNTCVTTDF